MAIETEKPDHRLGFTKDYLTAVISLATAVLGITATFAEKLTDGSAHVLLIAWIALGLSIVACLIAFGRIDRELAGQGKHASVALSANVAYFAFCLGLAMVATSAYNVARHASQTPDAAALIAALIKQAEKIAATGVGSSKLTLKSVAHDPRENSYVFIWTDHAASNDVSIVLKPTGDLLRLDRK